MLDDKRWGRKGAEQDVCKASYLNIEHHMLELWKSQAIYKIMMLANSAISFGPPADIYTLVP